MNKCRKRDRIYRIFMALIVGCMIFAVPVYAADGEKRTVKVANPIVTGHKDEMLEYSQDFLDKLSEYTGWKIEYLTFDAMSLRAADKKAREMVQSGEADLMGGMLKNGSNEEQFLFPEESYSTIYTTLYALDNNSISEYNYKQGSALRVGVLDYETKQNQEISAYLESSDSQYEMITCKSFSEQMKALEEERVDVISGTSTNPIPNCKVVANFAPRSCYLVFTAGNQALADEFDEGVRKLEKAQPFYLDNLASQHFEINKTEFDPSGIPKEILPSDGVINVLGFDGDAPYFFVDEDHQPAGFMYELLVGFAEETGQQIQFDIGEHFQGCEQLLREKEYDFIVGTPITPEECVNIGFIHSTPIVSEAISEIYRVGDDLSAPNKAYAMVYGAVREEEKQDRLVKLYDTVGETIEAVECGEADIAYAVSTNANFYLKEAEADLENTILYDNMVSITAALNKNLKPEYMALFNRYVKSIGEEQKTLMLQNAGRHAAPDLLKAFAKQHPGLAILIPVAFLGAIICSISLLLYTRKKNEYAESLRKTNSDLEEYQHMLKSISDGYQIVCQLNLAVGQYRVIETNMEEYRGNSGSLGKNSLGRVLDDMGVIVDKKIVEEFMDHQTMGKRLAGTDYLFLEIQNHSKNWRRIELFVSARKEGKPEIILLTVRLIDEEKQREAQLLRAQKELEAQIESGREWEYRAEHDALTGLLNRTAYERISKKINNLKVPVGFVLIDIDYFKEINDDYGHDIGDRLLKKAAEILNRHVRESDYAFRYGGDEFAILLCNTEAKNVNFIAKRIQEMSEQIATSDDEIPAATISAGVYFSKEGIDDSVYRYADEALYHTKQNGRAGCTVFDDDQNIIYENHEAFSLRVPMPKNKLLTEISTGTWRIEIPEDGQPRMFCDEPMLKLLGVCKYVSPEECYAQWFDRIDPEYVPYVLETVGKIFETGHAEITYPWHHPSQGIMMVRCGGTFDAQYKEGKCVYGTHQDISKLSIVTKKDDSNLIVDALNEVYFCDFYIDLVNQTYTAYKQTEETQKLLGSKGTTKNMADVFLQTVVSEEYYEDMKHFLRFDDIRERIEKGYHVECEYAAKLTKQWRRARFLPVKYDATGKLTHVLFVIAFIEEEKRIEWERQQQLSAIRAVNQMMFHSFQTFLGVVDVKSRQLQIMVNNESALPFASNTAYEFETAVNYALEHTVTPEDRDRYAKCISLDLIQQRLENTDRFDFTVNRVKPDQTTGLFAYHFCYYGDTKEKIICMAEEVTEREEMDTITEELTMQGFLRQAEYTIHNLPGEYMMLHWDIKGFKAINDQIGFERGNIILKEISSSIKNSALKPLMITRGMADHFYCLIRKEHVDYKEITRLCSQHIVVENTPIMTSMYCGVYVIDDKKTPVRYMCDKARLAENAVRESEGNCPYFIFTDQMKQQYLRQKEIIASLDDAVRNEEFYTYFQPVYDAKTCRIVSAEALVRWIKPDGQIISPDVFVPPLEENGQISRIDLIVNQSVQQCMCERYQKKRSFVPVSVNLSRIDLYNEEMMEQLLDSVKNAEIPKEYLRFEITESAYTEIPEQGAKMIKMLRDYGAKLLVDDFGKGYSSLGSLTEEAFDIVKLDMSFVRQIGQNDRAEAVIRASIEMTHLMKAFVIAEGVETQEQYEFLRDNNCDYIQGYYFSKPLSREAFEALLDAEKEMKE